MSKWKVVRLGEVCEFRYGKSLPESLRNYGQYSVFGSNGKVGTHNAAISKGRTIVIGRKGSIGEINLSDTDCWPIDTTYYVDETCTEADLKWLGYRLSALNLSYLNRAAAVPGLNRNDAYQLEFLLPPLPEQRRIATIMDHGEGLRVKRRQALELLDSLIQSLFTELFGTPEVQKDFPLVCLGDVAQFIDYRGISPNKQPFGVRLVTARNIKRGWFENDPEEFIPANEYESWMRRGKPQVGDVLFTTEGHTLGSAAKLPEFEKVALAQRLIALQPMAIITVDYLLQIILSRSFQAEVLGRSTGSAARGISSKQLGEIKIPLAPISLQREFAAQAVAIERLKAVQQASLTKMDELFVSLQHRAFSGEL